VPAPACSYLIQQGGIPVRAPACPSMRGELVTPTGASLLVALIQPQKMGEFPSEPWIIDKTGVGAGTRNPPEYPNICRLMVGHVQNVIKVNMPANLLDTTLSVLECNIDDMTAEIFGYVMELLISHDQVLDVWFTNIQMKKNRPALMLSVLCKPEHEKAVLEILFRETSTIGVRRRKVDRLALDRSLSKVQTRYGEVNVKCAFLNGKIINVAPEYEECKEIATKLKIPLIDVMDSAKCAGLGLYPNMNNL